MKVKKIGIALAAYEPDSSHFLEQLQSIAAQSWKDWVCVVVSDSKLDALRADSRYQPYFSDHRFQWFENSMRLGHLKNFEKAIQLVSKLGVSAIACSDQDDVWFTDKLSVQAGELESLGELGLVFCDMKIMNAAGVIQERTAWEVERRGVEHCGTFDLLVRNVIPGTGMLMDAELARRFPVIPEAALYHDHWYPLVASAVGKVRPIRQALYAYRIHESNVAGVSPYTGLLARKAGESRGRLQQCREVWKRSLALAQAAKTAGVPLGWWARVAFFSKWDLGLVLALRGLLMLPLDPALTRACWARSVGKMLGA